MGFDPRSVSILPGRAAVISLIVFFFLAHVIGIAVANRSITSGQIIAGDGLFYYEYLPSLLLDGDLNFDNQRATARQLNIPFNWQAPYLARTTTGLPGTPFAPGWAALTAPFFAVGHAISLSLSALGMPVRLDGYGLIDQFVTNLGAVIYGLIGIYLCYGALRRFYDDRISAFATITFVLCSNLPYYIIVHASMSHAVAFFCVALSIFCFVRLLEDEGSFVLFGAACGFALLCRPQLAPVVALLFLALLWRRRQDFLRLAASAAVCGAIAVLQLLVWKVVDGSFFTVPQGDDFLQPLHPHLMGVLFSLKHGFITWTPFVAFGVAGLMFGAIGRDHRVMYFTFLLAFASQVYINSIAMDWWSGNSFGYRRLIEIYPMLMFGVAWLMATGRKTLVVLSAAAVICAVFNALFFVQYRFCYIPRGEPITVRQLLVDKLFLFKMPRTYCDS